MNLFRDNFKLLFLFGRFLIIISRFNNAGNAYMKLLLVKNKGMDNYKVGQYCDSNKWLSWAVILLENSGDMLALWKSHCLDHFTPLGFFWCGESLLDISLFFVIFRGCVRAPGCSLFSWMLKEFIYISWPFYPFIIFLMRCCFGAFCLTIYFWWFTQEVHCLSWFAP